jgi:hypothetical protein
LEKLFHIHYFYQTNPKIHCKSKIEPITQPHGKLAHTKHSLLQPEENPPDTKSIHVDSFFSK